LVGPELPDLIAGLVSLISIIGFVQWWKPPYNEKYVATLVVAGGQEAIEQERRHSGASSKQEVQEHEHMPADETNDYNTNLGEVEKDRDNGPTSEAEYPKTRPANTLVEKPTLYEALFAWLPWMLIVVIVIIWSFCKVSVIGQINVHWPHLDNQIWLTLYEKKYAAIWTFQPLATGTAILIAGIVFLICVLLTGEHISIAWLSIMDTGKQLFFPIITVSFIMAFAYLYNFSGK
jgi:lactate permease